MKAGYLVLIIFVLFIISILRPAPKKAASAKKVDIAPPSSDVSASSQTDGVVLSLQAPAPAPPSANPYPFVYDPIPGLPEPYLTRYCGGLGMQLVSGGQILFTQDECTKLETLSPLIKSTNLGDPIRTHWISYEEYLSSSILPSRPIFNSNNVEVGFCFDNTNNTSLSEFCSK